MLWETIKESLQDTLPASEYGLWIKPIACRYQDEQVLELTGPDRYFCAWVQNKYLELIKKKLSDLGLNTARVNLSVAEQIVLPAPPPAYEAAPALQGQLQLPGLSVGSSSFRSLHPRYTFDHFMVGESNILARSACQALALGDLKYGNSLFLNSTTGLGKSHLTQAVAHAILTTSPATRLHYLTAQQFAAEMVKGIKSNTMDQFSKKYINNCDMLLMEDVHTLTGKVKTQGELNMILDYLLKSGKRVIFTSAVAPCNLAGLDTDFKSRMTAGLVTQIKTPDYDTRCHIIRHKALFNELCLNDEHIDYLGRYLEGDVRRMESVLLCIKAKICMLNNQPDLATIKEVLGETIGQNLDLDGATIMALISRQFKVSAEELRSKSRKRHLTFPRHVAMFLTRKYTDMSLSDIGSLYNRDHSTVLYAIKTITKDMSQKTATREQLELLSRKLKIA